MVEPLLNQSQKLIQIQPSKTLISISYSGYRESGSKSFAGESLLVPFSFLFYHVVERRNGSCSNALVIHKKEKGKKIEGKKNYCLHLHNKMILRIKSSRNIETWL